MWSQLISALMTIAVSLLVVASSLTEYRPPEKFSLGRPASKQDIQAMDSDVRPDGTGLPKGSGTVLEGERVYRNQCLSCHGVDGKGGVNDPLAGRLPNDSFPFSGDKAPKKTIGNYWPYATTLFDYIRRTMPYNEPGSLNDSEVYGLTAYILFINDIIEKDMVIDNNNLPNISMPAKHRFKNDDRLQFKQVH